MCCDAELKKTNSTPLIYNHILLKEGGQEKFMKELADLYNKYGIDTRLETHDFLLSEATWNFIAVIHNTMYAKDKLHSVEVKEEYK